MLDLTILRASILFALTALGSATEALAIDRSPGPHEVEARPELYPYAGRSGRVRDLINHFENHASPDRAHQKIITLVEAASRLHEVVSRKPPSIRCDRYVELISKPNIRTQAEVADLINRKRLHTEVQQKGGNPIVRMENEHRYDILSKIQTIVLSLESERVGGRSEYGPAVQEDLFGCLKYYTHRHQQATEGIIDYARVLTDSARTRSKADDPALAPYRDLVWTVKDIEARERHLNRVFALDWFDAASKLIELVQKSANGVPAPVVRFLARRWYRLDLYARNIVLLRAIERQVGAPAAGHHEEPAYSKLLARLGEEYHRTRTRFS